MAKKMVIQVDFQNRLHVLEQLLRKGEARTQDEICKSLKQRKFNVTQSTVSRDLRKIGAIKAIDTDGQTIYRLSEDLPQMPSSLTNAVSGLVRTMIANESMLVIKTSPGSAGLIASYIDSNSDKFGSIGTIAGDDTVFVAPRSIKEINHLIKNLEQEFQT